MKLSIWAERWRIPPAALQELLESFGVIQEFNSTDNANYSEADVLNQVRLEASKRGVTLWRNNVGATYTAEGRFIRYGLANDSAGINKKIKSADLIGIKPIVITHEMVGKIVGQFISREIKKPGWKFTASEHEEAQLKWIRYITARGGDAAFAAGVGTL